LKFFASAIFRFNASTVLTIQRGEAIRRTKQNSFRTISNIRVIRGLRKFLQKIAKEMKTWIFL
jgi:hypothetical protein